MIDQPATVRVALLTPAGRGALAVVGVAGADACTLADRQFSGRRGVSLEAWDDRSIGVGRWRGGGPTDADQPGEELVVVRHAADWLEVHCHGGHAAAEAVMASLEAAGAVRTMWPDWLRERGIGLIELEAREHLARAAGPRAARILCRQATGLLRDAIHRLASLSPNDLPAAAGRLVRAARVGLRLTEPWRCVLKGEVNSGKSSLANILAGHARSIVSPQPGTTRDLVSARLVLGGWEIELVDTAGLRCSAGPASATERAGIERGEAAARAADLVLQVVPVGDPLPPPAEGELLVITKADLAAEPPAAPPGVVVTSTVTRRGIDELIARIVAALVPEDTAEPDLLAGPVPFTARQVEIIRSSLETPPLATPRPPPDRDDPA